MTYNYPITLQLDGESALVVGGGKVAYRKVLALLECGADISLISPEIVEDFHPLLAEEKLTYYQRDFRKEDLDDIFLIIGATDDREVNSRIGSMAKEKNLLVNIVDQPEDCNFFVPAIHRAGSLTIAITTGGSSPALAGKIRRRLAKDYPEIYAEMMDWLADIRTFVKENLADPKRRRDILINLSFDIEELLMEGHRQEAIVRMDTFLSDIEGYSAFRAKFLKEYSQK